VSWVIIYFICAALLVTFFICTQCGDQESVDIEDCLIVAVFFLLWPMMLVFLMHENRLKWLGFKLWTRKNKGNDE